MVPSLAAQDSDSFRPVIPWTGRYASGVGGCSALTGRGQTVEGVTLE